MAVDGSQERLLGSGEINGSTDSLLGSSSERRRGRDGSKTYGAVEGQGDPTATGYRCELFYIPVS